MSAPTIDAGIFFLLMGLAFLGFLLIRRVTDYLLLSSVLFIALALIMFSGYDVIIAKNIDAVTTIQEEHNSTGQLVTNTTITTPAYSEKTSVVGGNGSNITIALGWVFFLFAMISILVWIRVAFT